MSSAAAAYLPVVGPAPIRIEPRPKPPRLPLPLPAPMPLPESATVTNGVAVGLPSSPAASTNATETLKAVSPTPAPVELPQGDSAPSAPPGLATESGPPVLTPQMLVPFFEHRTVRPDGKETGVIAPLPFVPPRTRAGSSSRAVLRTD